ncbi:MAG: bifunctional riboflavin kinase/FAD synthetase [Desulfoprunum sp.]|jgi:riboflavin kinase/FMN adenylyltransferase|uniref:bifunctional riboflavin kinase/FAD synthetase n=1 Tax=Desulfoprunum sp. TaxID=2020866 RepID=UPI00052E3962|nr:riboflavin biosynthesis protein RibF [Desulfobulbus sp. Tol-SR]
MHIYRQIEDIVEPFADVCVTIGNFDGVHLGHQMLFAEVANKAYRRKGTSLAITFEPHPLRILRPGGIKLISNCEQKIELIQMAGIDALLIIPFNLEFAATSAEHFVDDILLRRIGMKELVVGYDYAFGKGRVGNITFLREKGRLKGFPVTVVEAYYLDGVLVSSTKIRQLVAEGRVEEAWILLGRPYQIRGEVQVGKQRGGKEVGFPTANLQVDPEDLVPRHGVYVAQVICEGKCYGGVLNIGHNPTFGGQDLVAETHIFDFDQDIYGKPIKINLLKFLRGEHKFSSVAELASQIGRDVICAKTVLADQQKELMISCSENSHS